MKLIENIMVKTIVIVVLLTVIAFILVAKDADFASAQGLGNCDPSHNVKTESEPHTVSDISKIWVKAIIKAGSQNQGDACFEFVVDGDDGCYSVTGLGTATASATKIGSGKDCKDISHVEWFAEDINVPSTPTPEPSLDPSPSATPNSTPSPSIDPTATPSATPSPTPQSTPQPTSTPVASPTSTPQATSSPTTKVESVEVQQQRVIEEVTKENGGVMPQIGFK